MTASDEPSDLTVHGITPDEFEHLESAAFFHKYIEDICTINVEAYVHHLIRTAVEEEKERLRLRAERLLAYSNSPDRPRLDSAELLAQIRAGRNAMGGAQL